jgi:release factor glutamine methyltransferase
MEAGDLEAAALVATLSQAGCVAAAEEAVELLAAAADATQLGEFVRRRTRGEPLAWVTGHARFCDLDVMVDRGVFVPRWQSETVARAASEHLPADGRAVDLATGSGAVALALAAAEPLARVVGTELDPRAVACAQRNGVDVVAGSLFEPLPSAWAGSVDLVVGVLPYVPSSMLASLPREARDHEPALALDGGPDGLDVVRLAIADAPRWLRRGGCLVLEVGQDQASEALQALVGAGFRHCASLDDPEGDTRGVMGFLHG